MQIFNSGERVDLSNVCISLIFNLIHWATPKRLEKLLEESNISGLEEGSVYHLSQKIKDKYIASNSSGLREGSRKVSELTYKLDGYLKQTNGNGAVEKEMNDTIQEILKVFTEESISVFDLIRFGTLTSLVKYLSAGRELNGYDDVIEKRFEYFATVCSSNHTLLLSALQNALIYLEPFPVIVIGKNEIWVDAPKEGLVTSPGMKIRFVNDTEDDMGEEEDQSKEEEDQIVVVDSFSSLKEIQEYLFERNIP
ncbi:E3 ubiquitin-protein ligase upl4 [Orobanche gracilis]